MNRVLKHIGQALRLSSEDTFKNILKSLISSFGILFLISFLVLYVSLRDSIKNYVDKNIFGTLAIDEIKVTVKTGKQFDIFSQTQGVQGIRPGAVAYIKKMPEVKKVYSLIQMEHKTFIRGELMGQRKKVFMPIGSIENDFFRERDPKWRTLTSKDPLPLVAPRFAIDMLNNYLSMTGMPTFPPEGLTGFPIELTVQSTPPGYSPKKDYSYNAVIHSVTDQLPFMGIVVPSDFIYRFMREHAADSPEKNLGVRYVSLYVKVKDIKKLPETTAKIRKLGVQVESQQDVAAKTNKALSIIDGSSIVIIGMFLILTVISIFNSYLTIVYNRSQKFSLRRVLGVPKFKIILGFVCEAAFVGMLYGLLGYFAGNWMLGIATDYLVKWVPSLTGIVLQSAVTRMRGLWRIQ
ncbi:MAG: ABC transporter permease [Spirochaetota bacterium]